MHLNGRHSGPLDRATPTVGEPSGRRPRPVGLRDQRRAERRLWVAAAWIGGSLALFAVLLRISLSWPMDSDGANNALQAWDMLHGHLLLPGWIIGDASVYTFELPLYAIIEFFFGLTGVVFHIGAALTYLIVMAFSVALACANSHGPSVAARCGVVVGVLAAPIVTQQGVSILLAAPDHIGTSVFLLGSFLLIERAPARHFTPPLLAVVLCAGQIGDGLVLYVAVPAVLLVSAYRILAARKIRTSDAAIAVAAAASVPLASLTRAVMLHFGGYSQIPPRTAISPIGQWPEHLVLTWRALRTLYGAFGATVVDAHAPLSGVAAVFGLACLLAAAFGFAKVVWTWRSASRGEQLLCVAIVVNLAAYVASMLPSTYSSREIVAVLPCGAVLAARACVPSRIVGARRARAGLTAAALVAVLPLAAAATLPPVTAPAVPLAAWLKAHGLSYGIAGYWDASAVTLQSGDQIQVRAVARYSDLITGFYIAAYDWETKAGWYDASRHDATFVIANGHYPDSASLPAADVVWYFGRPAATFRVAGHEILVYQTNLLERLGRLSRLRRPATASG
jgi:hypothetical protein